MVFTAFLFGAVGTADACFRRTAPGLADCLFLGAIGYALLTLAVMTKGPVVLRALVVFFGVLCGRGCGRRAGRDAIRLDWPRSASLLVSVGACAVVSCGCSATFRRTVSYGDYLLAGNLFYLTKPDP